MTEALLTLDELMASFQSGDMEISELQKASGLTKTTLYAFKRRFGHCRLDTLQAVAKGLLGGEVVIRVQEPSLAAVKPHVR